MKENPWINRVVGAIFAIAMAVSSYFLNSTIEQIEKLSERVSRLELKNAETSGNRFSSVDWMREKSLLDADRLLNEKRLIRIEESIPVIKESLARIEKSIERLTNEQ
jgi:hypothetical protein